MFCKLFLIKLIDPSRSASWKHFIVILVMWISTVAIMSQTYLLGQLARDGNLPHIPSCFVLCLIFYRMCSFPHHRTSKYELIYHEGFIIVQCLAAADFVGRFLLEQKKSCNNPIPSL